ncbi:MAG: glutamate 5-kinase [Chloroflexi bacterium]|nr:glutamate 5-kinase [Chloroflexota bacterium]
MKTSKVVAHRVVIKVGSSTLTAGTARLNRRRMLELAQQIVQVREKHVEVLLVTSGAIAAGRERFRNSHRPLTKSVPVKQMLAAVGQSHLMLAWEQIFDMFDVQIGQVLLTRADLSDRRHYLNARDALNAMLAHQTLPVINENDAIATEEIRVGDNDNLSALVANVVQADLLLILTDQDGLFTADPRKDATATLIREVAQLDESIWTLAGASRSGLGVGGMTTKLQAADLATRSGVTVVIANGGRQNAIMDAVCGESVGTCFLPVVNHIESRKRWILSERTTGAVIVDEGAAHAVCDGKSLLPVGVREVIAEFDRGEVIAVRDSSGRDIAHGISRYSAAEARRIAGRKSVEIEGVLGFEYASMLIHTDDMVLMNPAP